MEWSLPIFSSLLFEDLSNNSHAAFVRYIYVKRKITIKFVFFIATLSFELNVVQVEKSGVIFYKNFVFHYGEDIISIHYEIIEAKVVEG